MSFFAGFVQGVFEGKDWREAKNDRERKRKMEDERFEWAREDRDWTGEARNRQRGEWGRTDQERSRADQEREEAEASQRRVDESRRQALGLGDEQGSGREMSVRDAVPDTDRPAPPSESRTAPPPSSQGLTVRGALGELGQGAQGDNVGSNVMQDRLSDRVAGQQTAQAAPAPTRTAPVQQAAAAPQQLPQGAPVQQAAAAPDPALVAEGAQIAGVQPYVPGQERGAPAQPQPPAQGGFSLNNLIASPAAASTMPEGGPQTERRVNDEAQARAQGIQDRGEAFNATRNQEPSQASAAAQGRAGRINETVRGLMPQTDPVTGILNRLNRDGMRIAGVASDAAGVAQSAVGATDAGARSFDRAQGMRDAGARMDAQRDAQALTVRPQPAGQVAPAPQQQGQRGVSQRTDETQFFIGDTPMSLSGRKPVNTGTVADLVGEVTGSPVSEGSMKAAGDSISKNAGMSAAQALKSDGSRKPPTKAEVRAVAKEAGVRFQKTEVDRHARVLEAEGRFEEVTAWREFAQGENTRLAMEKLSEAMFYWDMNDEGNALQSVVELYNMNGYYDDGLSALSEGTAFSYDAQGNINGLTVTFRDEASGEVFQRQVRGPRDKVMAVVIGSLSPEATFAAAMEMVGGLKPQQTETPMPDITHADWRGYLDQARKGIAEERGLEIAAVPQAEVEQRAREIIARLPNARNIQRYAAQGDVPLMQ